MPSNRTKKTKRDDTGLSERQKAALPHLVGCRTYEEGCKRAGIGKQTLYTWLQGRRFREEIEDLREAIVDEAVGILKANITKASCALVELLEISDNPSIKRAVANDIIGHVFKVKEFQEFEERLAALEQSFESRKAI
jgi:hypothetical protein